MKILLNITKNAKPGFSDRLSSLLALARQREHGQIKMVAALTGLSQPGARKLFIEDRPPRKPESFTSLVSGIRDLLKAQANIELSDQKIESYLLDDSLLPEIFTAGSDSRTKIEGDDPLVAGAIHLRIYEIGTSLGVNLYSDLQDRQLSKAIARIFDFYSKKTPPIGSPDFDGIIKAQILLAKANVT